MRIGVAVVGILMSWVSLSAFAGEWDLEKHDEALDIKVFTREIEGSELREFKGVTHIKAPLNAFVALIKDEQAATQWFHEMANYKIVKATSEQEAISYSVNKTPWPVTDRDSYILSTISQDKSTGVVTVKLEGKPNFKPRNEGYVRMEGLTGHWNFIPQKEGRVEVVYQVHADPGGSLPDWLVNSIVIDSPYNTLKNMHQMLGQGKYLSATHDFIAEP